MQLVRSLKDIRGNKGFTLIELLIVIVIIGILAVLIIPSLTSGPARARDSQRKADLRNLKTALESYYNDNNAYPTSLSVLEQGSVPYIKIVPTDPETKQAFVYITSGNPPNSYILKATLENKNDKDIKSGTTDVYEVSSSNWWYNSKKPPVKPGFFYFDLSIVLLRLVVVFANL